MSVLAVVSDRAVVGEEFQECGQAHAELTGAMAVAADGATVQLDDVSLSNARFGCSISTSAGNHGVPVDVVLT